MCWRALDLGLVVEEIVAVVACCERLVEGNSSVRRTSVQNLDVQKRWIGKRARP